jgi:CheY-like chemotaxis protein
MEALGTLTGGMAHDFNNGLGVIIGNLDLLGRRVEKDAMAAELCGDALQGATRCAELIRRLLAFARRQTLRPEQIDVNALVSDITRLLGRTLGENVAIMPKLDAACWPVTVDPAQLEAALLNLATNARDAMPKGGEILITTRNVEIDAAYQAQQPDVSVGEFVLIEVTDTGTGIPPEIISRIFEPFFTTKGPGRGTGLGLSMAFGFAKQSGGHLAAYSEPGQGSTFRLYLPRGNALGPAEAATRNAEPPIGGDETLLMVEDNADLRQVGKKLLTELGYTVIDAMNADEALPVLESEQHLDLIFSDVVMPGTMDGLDLAYRSRAIRPGLKVLLASGFPGVREGNQRLTGSPFRLLNKPYGRDELARAIRMALGKSDLVREESGASHREEAENV